MESIPGALKRIRIRALLTGEQWGMRRLFEVQDGMKRLKCEDDRKAVFMKGAQWTVTREVLNFYHDGVILVIH